MHDPHISEQNLAARYIVGDLPDEERAAFEEHFVDCPVCLAEIEATRDFRDGLSDVSAAPAFFQPAPGQPWHTYLAWAACAIITVITVWYSVQARRSERTWKDLYANERKAREALGVELARTQRQTDMSVDAPIFTLALSRGVNTPDNANQIVLPSTPQWLILSLDRAGLPDMPAYHARLEDAAGRVIWTGGDLHPTSSDALGVSLRSELLDAGNYVLVVDGVQSSGPTVPVGRYSFRAAQKK